MCNVPRLSMIGVGPRIGATGSRRRVGALIRMPMLSFLSSTSIRSFLCPVQLDAFAATPAATRQPDAPRVASYCPGQRFVPSSRFANKDFRRKTSGRFGAFADHSSFFANCVPEPSPPQLAMFGFGKNSRDPFADAKSAERWLAAIPTNDAMAVHGATLAELARLTEREAKRTPGRLEAVFYVDRCSISNHTATT